MAKPLPSYLRTYRKRHGFSQREVAFLLGVRSGTPVSRYERLSRRPHLSAALGLEVIFGADTRRMFPGAYATVERQVLRRAKTLLARLETQQGSAANRRKIEYLQTLLEQTGGEDR